MRRTGQPAPSLMPPVRTRPSRTWAWLAALVGTITLADAPALAEAPPRPRPSALPPSAAPDVWSPYCVFLPYSDSPAMQALLGSWARDAGLGALRKWNAQITMRQARLEIATERWTGVIILRLGRSCSASPGLFAIPRSGSAPGQYALALLAQRFPAGRRVIMPPRPRASTAPERILSPQAIVALVLLLVAFMLEWPARRRPWLGRAFVALSVVVCGGLALWTLFPLFTAPFGCDAPVLRIAYGRENPFGDWNHPFLPYLLNHPVLRVSLEPWAARIVPFSWIVAELGMLIWLTRRWSGSLTAGALAGLWMVWELPRRPSIDVLSDWDLAGAFLLGLLGYLGVWWQRTRSTEHGEASIAGAGGTSRGSIDRRTLGALAAIMTLGFFSSYMMIVPLGVFVLGLWATPEARRGRLALPITACFLVLGSRALIVFGGGRTQNASASLSLDTVLAQVTAHLPLQREPAMLMVTVAALVALLLASSGRARRSAGSTDAPGESPMSRGGRPGRAAGILLVGSLIAIPFATLVAWRFSHVNNGYYACLATPLWFLVSATLLGWSGIAIRDRVAGGHPGGSPSRWARGAAGLGLAVAILLIWHFTLATTLPVHDPRSLPEGGGEHLSAFDTGQRARPLTIVTNAVHLPLYLSYERARRGHASDGGLLDGPSEILARSLWMDSRCRPSERQKGNPGPVWSWADLRGSFYVVTESSGAESLACLEQMPFSCTRLFPKRPWLNFYRCHSRNVAPVTPARR